MLKVPPPIEEYEEDIVPTVPTILSGHPDQIVPYEKKEYLLDQGEKSSEHFLLDVSPPYSLEKGQDGKSLSSKLPPISVFPSKSSKAILNLVAAHPVYDDVSGKKRMRPAFKPGEIELVQKYANAISELMFKQPPEDIGDTQYSGEKVMVTPADAIAMFDTVAALFPKTPIPHIKSISTCFSPLQENAKDKNSNEPSSLPKFAEAFREIKTDKK